MHSSSSWLVAFKISKVGNVISTLNPILENVINGPYYALRFILFFMNLLDGQNSAKVF